MRRIIILFVGIMAMCGMVAAQDYHAAALWDATGPVKELKYKTKNPMAQAKKMKFTEEGRLSSSMIFYGDNGYPLGMDMNMFGRFLNISFKFGDNNLLSEVIYNSNVGGWGCFTSTFAYDANTMVSQEIKVTDKKTSETTKEYSYRFSGYTYDETGNWTARNVVVNINDLRKGKTEQLEYLETREIKYY